MGRTSSIGGSPFQKLGVPLMAFRPNAGLIVIEPDPPEVAGVFGRLVVPKNAEDMRFEARWGKVVKLGPMELTKKTRKPIAFQVAVGERVLLSRFGGHDIEDSLGKKYVVVGEQELLLGSTARAA